MIQYPNKYQHLQDLGKRMSITQTQKNACVKFNVNLYGGHDQQSLTEVRCQMAMEPKHPRSLPATEEVFICIVFDA